MLSAYDRQEGWGHKDEVEWHRSSGIGADESRPEAVVFHIGATRQNHSGFASVGGPKLSTRVAELPIVLVVAQGIGRVRLGMDPEREALSKGRCRCWGTLEEGGADANGGNPEGDVQIAPPMTCIRVACPLSNDLKQRIVVCGY